MATPQAVESFWTQLVQSGLMSAQQVDPLARQLSSEAVTTDAAVARKLVELGHLTRFQADRLLEGRSRGFFYDKYKLLDFLGVGGMSWVYRAENIETGEIVALKVLLDQFRNDQGMIVRFENEARAGLRLKHENVVNTFGYGSAGGLPYVVMEYVQGPTLLELLRQCERNRLGWEEACEIGRQAAIGLQHMHQAGCIHRDIKPQNLLVDVSGHVKLLDFGLTMIHEGEAGDEFSMAMIFGHECVGTAAFMAPEQAADSLKADARSDVYGLGCTLFAILTGDTPFPYSETKEVLKGHQSQIPRNVCDIVPAIPKAVGEIVAKMLAKSPADRFASAAEVAAALSVWSSPLNFQFDFEKILADRNRVARQKLAELQRRHKSSANAANSTVKPSVTSSIASKSTTVPMASVGLDNRTQGFSSSVVRRDPFGFEHPPPIIVHQTAPTRSGKEGYSAAAIQSEMVLLPLNGEPPLRLLKDHFVVGRSTTCDLQVQDASVSSRHCELVFDGHEWTINDLRSRNGIRVNGEIVRQQSLRPGDTIVIGSTLRIRFDHLRRRSFLTLAKPVSLLAVTLSIVAVVAFAAVLLHFWNHR